MCVRPTWSLASRPSSRAPATETVTQRTPFRSFDPSDNPLSVGRLHLSTPFPDPIPQLGVPSPS